MELDYKDILETIIEHMGLIPEIDHMSAEDVITYIKRRWDEIPQPPMEIWWVTVDGDGIDTLHFLTEEEAVEFARDYYKDTEGKTITSMEELEQGHEIDDEGGVWQVYWGSFNLTSLVNKEYDS